MKVYCLVGYGYLSCDVFSSKEVAFAYIRDMIYDDWYDDMKADELTEEEMHIHINALTEKDIYDYLNRNRFELSEKEVIYDWQPGDY